MPKTRSVYSRSFGEALFSGGKLTTVAHSLWKEVVRPGDFVVDATCGNGNDTLFLATLAGSEGRLVAFDVQDAAVATTRERLEGELDYEFEATAEDVVDGTSRQGPSVRLVRRSHAELPRWVDAPVKLVCFNLGYLPGGSKDKTTETASTLTAVRSALEVVTTGGLVSVAAYPGHDEGQRELTALREMSAAVPSITWLSFELRLVNRSNAPVLLGLYKQLS